MRGHKPDDKFTLHGVDFPQQFCKGNRLFQIFSVGVDVLPQQHDFLVSVLNQVLDFSQNHFRLPTAFPSPYIRNDAIGAEVVATVHNRNRRFESAVANLLHLFGRHCSAIHIIDEFFRIIIGCQQTRQFPDGGSSHENINKGIVCPYFFQRLGFRTHTAA